MPVPIAVIICKGDIGTISHIAGALQQNLPVIKMKSSGKVADLILDYAERFAKSVINSLKDSFIYIIDLHYLLQTYFFNVDLTSFGKKLVSSLV